MFKSHDIHNDINVYRFKDRSRTFANGRIDGSIRTWANRFLDKRIKTTQLLRVQGQIVPKLGTANLNGVYYPPRFNRA